MVNGDRPVEFRSIAMPVWLMLVAGAAVMAGLIWVVTSWTTESMTEKWVPGSCIAAAGLIAIAGAARRSRPVTVSNESLTIPHMWKSHTIALTEVSGVGLVLTRPGPLAPRLPAFWFLAVWRSDGTMDRASLSCSGDIDRASLVETAPGKAAKIIAERVIDVQGTAGLLASRTLQETVTYDPRRSASGITWWSPVSVVAWWSPDGSFGDASIPLPKDNETS